MASAITLLLAAITLVSQLHPAQCLSPKVGSSPSCIDHDRCRVELSPDLVMQYRVHFPDDYRNDFDEEEGYCEGCKLHIKLIYEGYTWLGIGISSKGEMVGSTVVIGQPGVVEPSFYNLDGKDIDYVTRSDPQLELEDTSVEYTDGQTIMKFTTPFSSWKMRTPIRQSLNNLYTFIWAHGKGLGEEKLGYHGPGNKSSFTIDDLLGFTLDGDEQHSPSAMTLSHSASLNDTVWLIHGLMAFVAFGVFIPLAVTTALFHDFESSTLLPLLPTCCESLLISFSKRWLYIHISLNTLTSILTLFVFMLGFLTIKGEESSQHWYYAHSKMGLVIFSLVWLQVLGGYFRPRKNVSAETSDDAETEEEQDDTRVGEVKENDTKCSLRRVWEALHRILGVALFFVGMWQMNEGMALYHARYHLTNSFVTIATLYLVWMALWASVIVGGTLYKWLFQKKMAGGGDGTSAVETVHPEGGLTEVELS